MHLKITKPLTDAELEAYEARRDLAADLLQSVREMKAGEGRIVNSAELADLDSARASGSRLS